MKEENRDHAFDLVRQADRVARTARMLNESEPLTPGQRKDIIERGYKFLDENPGYTQAKIARELGISDPTFSSVLKERQTGKAADKHLTQLHNWLELEARRDNIIRNREFIETTVALAVIGVARIVAETCKMGVVYGPAQIGKTFTLQAIEGDQGFGDPVLLRITEATLRPLPLCRAIAARFKLQASGTFDALFLRLVNRLKGTKRMLMFDEVERVHYKTLETIRDLHDQTGCPVLLSGKPLIYRKLGQRQLGDFSEVTDQLASRIVVKRDLTEHARGKNPQPLFSQEDIRKLIHNSDLKLRVSPDAVKWLQTRASSHGCGGIGKVLVSLYLAAKIAYASSEDVITAATLEKTDELTMGHEDAKSLANTLVEIAPMRRVV
ncbi:MAG: AAA family ATPase [Phycisphaerae bacterium]|nr:AAA family ATPase [Phycisphaerae bacterium]